MAIGAKGDDHEEIERLFTEELDVLSTTGGIFYHAGLKRLIRVKAGKIMTCVDRPERTVIFCIITNNLFLRLTFCLFFQKKKKKKKKKKN
jgi:hypothetical protein